MLCVTMSEATSGRLTSRRWSRFDSDGIRTAAPLICFDAFSSRETEAISLENAICLPAHFSIGIVSFVSFVLTTKTARSLAGSVALALALTL